MKFTKSFEKINTFVLLRVVTIFKSRQQRIKVGKEMQLSNLWRRPRHLSRQRRLGMGRHRRPRVRE